MTDSEALAIEAAEDQMDEMRLESYMDKRGARQIGAALYSEEVPS
jgi:hypothetical protein